MNNTIQHVCLRKIKFKSEIEANISIRRMIANGKNKWELHSYKCQFCDGFHIGHANKSEQEFIKNVVKSKRPLPPIIRMKK